MNNLFADDDETDDEDNLPLRELTRLRGGTCHDCQTQFRDAEALYSVALGFKNAPRCLACLAKRLSRDSADLEGQLYQYIQKRDCYRRAWATISSPVEAVPATDAAKSSSNHFSATPEPVTSWNAGDLGCGELVMELRIRLKKIPAGSVYEVIAHDPAAPEDIPAWCRMCGHELLHQSPPVYWIRRSGA